MRMRLTYIIFVQSGVICFYRHYASEASEAGETPVFSFLIFSTSCALNSSKFSGFATELK